MKKSFFLFFFICATIFSFGQDLQVHSNDKGLYLMHHVAAKENFYSIGRLYNIAPKELAAYNAVDLNNGLSVGQSLMIPLTATNFSQSATTGTPVYYTVAEKEGLYRVSMNNNKVGLEELRKWNNLSGDNISVGQKLIIGYLLSTELQQTARIDQSVPAQRHDLPVNPPKTETTPQKTEPQKNNATPVSNKVVVGGAGYFKSQFEQQSRGSAGSSKNATVTSGIFKTASGWQDAKYYALLDQVEPGTIVQVINPSNNKAIYAKVLGEMSGIRQNQGLELRISNAAAAALDVADTEKFIVRVSF